MSFFPRRTRPTPYLPLLQPLEPRRFLSGNLVPTFGSGGIVNNPYRSAADGVDIAVLSDGKILVVGDSDDGTSKDLLLTRFNPNGSADTTFGTNGVVIMDIASAGFPDIGTGLQVLPDGRFYVSGVTGNTSAGQGDYFAARFTSTGALDTTFAGTGWKVIDLGGIDASTASYYDASTERFILAGTSLSSTGGGVGLVSLNHDGSFTSGFGTNGVMVTNPGLGKLEGALDIARASDGLVVSGFSASAGIFDGPSVSQLVAKYSAETGEPIPTFGTAGRSTLTFGNPVNLGAGVAVDHATGKIVVVGTTADGNLELSPGSITGPLGAGAQNGEFTIARLNPDGSPDTTFSDDGKATTGFGTNIDGASGVVLQRDGKVVLSGGSQDKTTGDSSFLTARFNPDGTLDTSFANGGVSFTDLGASDGAFDIAMTPDGKIFLTGHSKGVGSGKLTILQLDNDGLKALPGIVINNPRTTPDFLADAEFKVSLTDFSDQPITVRAFTQDGTAKLNINYRLTEAVLTFAPGETVQRFEVALLQERGQDVDKSFSVNLADATNALILTPSGTATLIVESTFGLDLEVDKPNITRVPTNLIGGTKLAKGVLQFLLFNPLAPLVKGLVNLTVYGSPNATLNTSSNPILGRAKLKPNLKKGKSLNVKTNLIIPRVTDLTQMTVFIVLDGAGIPAGKPLVSGIETPLTVQPARVSLSGPSAPLAPLAVGNFKKFNATLPLTNTGNVDAVGSADIEFSLVGNGRTFTYITKRVKLNIKPGKTTTLKVPLTSPPLTPTGNFGALPSGTYTLRAKLLSSTLAGATNDTNGQILATTPFTLG